MLRAAVRIAFATGFALAGGCGGSDAGPAPDRGRVTVDVEWPGASPAAVETSVTEVLEHGLGSLPGVAAIESRSRTGAATIEVVPADAAQLDALAQAARAAVDAARPQLPEGVVPSVRPTPAGVRQARVLVMVPAQVEQAVRALESKVGVRRVRVCGVRVPRYQVRPDPMKLAALGVTALDVVDALSSIRMPRAPDSLGELPVPTPHRAGLRLDDVATVTATERAACHLGTSPGAGVLLVVELAGAEARRRWTEILAQLRGDGLELSELSAARTLTAAIEPGPASRASRDVDALELGALAQQVDDLDGVRWVVATRDDDATAVQLAIGLETVDAIGAVDTAVTALMTTPRTPPPRFTGGVAGLEAVLRGPDLEALRRAATAIVDALRAQDLPAGCDPCDRTPALTFEVDRARAAELGVDAAAIARSLRLVVPEVVASWSVGATDVDVVLELVVADDAPRALAELRVRAHDDTLIPLDALVRAQTTDAPTTILRRDRERAVVVWTRGSKARAALAAAVAAVAAPGIRTTIRAAY